MSSILNRRVLLLNQSYEPLMLIGVKKAIILLVNEKIDTLENYNEIINSVNLSLPAPSVVKLKYYAKIKRKEIVLSRRNILKRDSHTCQYCNIKSVPMTIDHVIPKNNGGIDSWENLVAACVPCNTRKGKHLLSRTKMKLSKAPRKPTVILHLQKFVKQYQSSWRPYLFMKGES